ncbi:hypothetical protein BC829DRAFT_398850 [Chytridium lagenaria]|nr:hypothetical protein BC829DRAFT_398850 [Chytridium lagenaria]
MTGILSLLHSRRTQLLNRLIRARVINDVRSIMYPKLIDRSTHLSIGASHVNAPVIVHSRNVFKVKHPIRVFFGNAVAAGKGDGGRVLSEIGGSDKTHILAASDSTCTHHCEFCGFGGKDLDHVGVLEASLELPVSSASFKVSLDLGVDGERRHGEQESGGQERHKL